MSVPESVAADALTEYQLHPARMSFDNFLALPLTERIWLARRSGDGSSRMRARDRARIFLAFSRPRTCVPMVFAFQLGLQFAGIGQSLHATLGATAFFAIGMIANLFNIYSDIGEDSANMPMRVYHLIGYGRTRLLWHTTALCVLTLATAAFAGPLFLGVIVLALVGAHQYSLRPLRLKERPVLGILLFATVVAYPFGAIVALAPDVWSRVTDPAFILACLYLLVWFCAKGLVKNVPDFAGDADVRLATSATVWGSRTRAARGAAVVTVAVYAGIALPVIAGAFPVRVLFALLWLPLIIWQGVRLIRAESMSEGNEVLRTDMLISTGFLASLILLVEPTPAGLVVVALGAALTVAADLLRLDSRTEEDSIS
ncbi:UbiA family prenyltransferase [Nocardia higoensis]|uniref:UbiA family prenyltransferase n=1 Tax=Nocardia higoensis TaxID=228599 RepID=UPI000595347D|nr:UbiA family prenyltransferase [Nocardia higoensis]